MTIVNVETVNMIAGSGRGYDPNTSASGADAMGREGGGWFDED